MDRGADQRSIKKMTANYVVVLVVLAIIALCNFYVMRASIKGEQATAAVINVSGRQRMLLQRSAMFAQRLLVKRDEPSRKLFLDTIERIGRSHEGLIEGDKELKLPGIRSAGVRSIFFDAPLNLDKQVREFINEAMAFAAYPADELTFDNPHLLYIENSAATGLLDSFDILVHRYQSESEGRIIWMATLTTLLFVVSLVVLIFMGLAVFRPMVRRIRLEMERITGAEARISAVVASMMDGLVTFDEDGIVETINSSACLIFGYKEDEITGESAQKLIPELFWQGRVDLNTIDMVMRETSARRSDGSEFPLEYSLSEVRVADKRIYVASVRDISERKRIEQEIIAQNIVLEDSSRDERVYGSAMALFTSTHNTDKILDGTLALLAEDHPYSVSALYLYDEWKAKFICRASHGARDSLKKEFDFDEGLVGLSIEEKKAFIMESGTEPFFMSIETGVGWSEPAAVIISPIFYQEKIIGVLMVASSIALGERDRLFMERLAAQFGVALNNLKQYDDLKDLSDQLRQQGEEISRKNVELEQANRMKSEFLANMSHELRTPLNSIIGFSEVLKDGVTGKLNPEQTEYAGDIFDSGHHLLSLVNDILDLAKIEAGKMTLNPETVDVRGVIEKSVSLFREKALNSGVVITANIQDGIEGVFLDGRKFKQIIFNLLSNAVKFTERGGHVYVEASMLEIDSKEFFEVVVRDTGIGIAPDEIKKLFTPFVQLDASMSRRFEGTGLGLAMVKRLTALHNGTVSIESEEGKGTSFIVRFPVELEAEALILPIEKDTRKPARRKASGKPVEAPVVLVVEDNDASAELIRLKLVNEGLKVVRARSAEDALEEVAVRPPDLIILDIILPGMDGWDFLSRIRSHETLSHTPVVIVSILAEDNRNKGFSLGATQVLQKPLDNEQLLLALSEIGGLGIGKGEGAKVLVVDDDPKAVELVSLHLEKKGFEVLRAYSGADAIEMAGTRKPALILLDLMMPGVTGFDVVDELRIKPETARIPVIILTAKQITEEDRVALNGGIARIVNKSDFNHGSFISEVRRAMQYGNGAACGSNVS